MSKRSCCGHSFMWFIFNLHRICPRLRCSICNSRLSSSFLPFAPLRPECLYVICAHQWPQERGVSTPSTAHPMAQLGGGTLIHWARSCSTEGLSFTNDSFCHPRLCCALFPTWTDVLQEEKEEIAKTFSGTSLFTSEAENRSASANTPVLIKAKLSPLFWRRKSLEMFCGVSEFCVSRNRGEIPSFS